MQKLVLASANKHKIKEFGEIFKGYEIVPMSEYGFTEDIAEDGKTFFENALIKAKAVSKFLKDKNIELPVIADDSGLCVDALGGEPGIMTARYAGGHDNKEDNRALLIKNLKDKQDKSAHFNCTIVIYMPNEDCIFTEGITEGTIIEEERGNKDFGYDCIFLSKDLNKTFGEATPAEKNKVSHRGRAIKQISAEYKKYLDKQAPKKKLNKAEVIRAIKFVFFSASAGIIQMGSFALLNELINWSYWPSYLISLTLSVLWNFTLNREFTFKSANNVPVAMLKVAIFYLIFTPLSLWWGEALSGKINEYIILAFTMIINFVGEFLYCRFFVYKDSINTNKRVKENDK